MNFCLSKMLTLGVIATTSLGVVAIHGVRPLPAVALTPAQVVDILSTVPVFIIVNGNGVPLTTFQMENGRRVERPVVFIRGADADAYLASQDQAAFADDARVAPVWLGNLYQQLQIQDYGDPGLAYFPTVEAVDAAIAIDGDYNRGVPLFVARLGESYLSVRQAGTRRVPMFFSRADLQVLLDQFAQANPEAATTVTVDVISLETIIRAMENDAAPELNQIRLFPASDVVEALQN